MTERWKMPIAVVAALASFAGCGGSVPASDAPGTAQSPPPTRAESPRPAKNACALVALEQLESIAKEKLEMLHSIEADDETVCELSSAAAKTLLVAVTVHWKGGKELARVNQAATSMAKQMLNEDDVDIEELTGSAKVRGLADKAYYSDVMPSWFLKGDVLIEVISPRFGHDQTRAVFVSVAKSASSQL